MPETDYKLLPEAKEAIRGYLVSVEQGSTAKQPNARQATQGTKATKN